MKKQTAPVNPARLKAQAAKLLAQVQKERKNWMLPPNKRPKTKPASEVVRAAPPDLHVAFVQEVVAAFVMIGTPKGRSFEMWNNKDVPWAAERVAQDLMRKRLPFTDELIADMLHDISGMTFLSLVGAIEPLVRELDKRAAKQELPERTQNALARIADKLLGRDLKGKRLEYFREEYGFPEAAARKLAGRIERLLDRN